MKNIIFTLSHKEKMITRRILIVGSPVNEDYSFQMGVKADIINYQRYFKSSIGGAFNPYDEITVLKTRVGKD